MPRRPLPAGKPEWVQMAIDVPDPGRLPTRLPSPIKMARLELITPSDCAQVKRCRKPAVAVLQLPSGRRMVLCKDHVEYHERLGK